MSDQREDFQKMVDQWEKAQQDGIFGSSKKPPVPAPDQYAMPTNNQHQQDYGMSPQMAAIAANSEKINDADYWSAIFKLSRGEAVEDRPTGGRLDPNPNSGLMQESTNKNKWTTQAPNPVPFWTRGKDQDNAPAHWFDPDDLNRLARMKEDLHNLGNKLAGSSITKGVKSEAVLKEIRNLSKKIDNLSDNLSYPETKGGDRRV
jgi:hypothetical protein